MTRFRSALVIGKFLPPHAGHHLVVDRALAAADHVDVITCDLPGQVPPASTRAGWVAEIHPSASVSVVPDICGWHAGRPCPPACSPRWADHLGGSGRWDAVFGSDDYVRSFATALGAEPVLVDPARTTRPISGTAIRDDLAGSWSFLHPVVRAGLTRRVVILGAESTGTTTLARDLAAALGAPWVPEYGRQLSAERAARAGSIDAVSWTTEDFDLVADEQEALERSGADHLARGPAPGPAGPVVVCDTDVLATAMWHRRYVGTEAPRLLERAWRRPPFLYVLTSPAGVGFEQDGLRDGPHLRAAMTAWFRSALLEQPRPWVEAVGDRGARVRSVLAALHRLTVAEPLFAIR